MKRPTFVSLFTGGDGAGWGADAAGYEVLGGVEFRPDIAAVAQANHPAARFIVGDVRAADYTPWRGTDHLHASPSCKKASIANADRGETAEDRETAQAVCRAIREIEPWTFTLENVRGYAAFEAYAAIIGTLQTFGYGIAAGVLNSADYGVPQTRERLIVVAVRGLPSWAVSLPAPTHARRRGQGAQMALFEAPALPPWVGWYEAIVDLIPTLPASAFAPWQLARLPEEVRGSVLISNSTVNDDRPAPINLLRVDEPMASVSTQAIGRARAFIAGSGGYDGAVVRRDSDEPVFTMTATDNAQQLRAWLMRSDNAGQEITPERQIRHADEPAPTTRTSAPPRAWLAAGRVVQMTPRALARFQSFPDAYALPERASLACEIIGNAVPPLLMRRIMEHVKRLRALHYQEAAR